MTVTTELLPPGPSRVPTRERTAPGRRGVARRPGRHDLQRWWRSLWTPPEGAAPSERALFSAVGLLALLLLSLVLEVSVVGSVRHARAQAEAYQELRYTLAAATAPVGQVDLDGRPLSLGTPIGLIEIPRIGVDEVILEGTTGEVLTGGPGHRRDTPLPGQAGVSLLFGRQAGYGGPFADLDRLVAGDTITVTTGQGVHTFAVTGLRRAGDPVPTPATDQSRLTLVTAAGSPFLPDDALRVDADLVGDVVPTPARVLGPASLTPAEEVMAGDRGAALPLFLWSELLLLALVGVAVLRRFWGRWHSWIVGLPVLVLCVAQVDHQLVVLLLPNLV